MKEKSASIFGDLPIIVIINVRDIKNIHATSPSPPRRNSQREAEETRCLWPKNRGNGKDGGFPPRWELELIAVYNLWHQRQL